MTAACTVLRIFACAFLILQAREGTSSELPEVAKKVGHVQGIIFDSIHTRTARRHCCRLGKRILTRLAAWFSKMLISPENYWKDRRAGKVCMLIEIRPLHSHKKQQYLGVFDGWTRMRMKFRKQRAVPKQRD